MADLTMSAPSPTAPSPAAVTAPVEVPTPAPVAGAKPTPAPERRAQSFIERRTMEEQRAEARRSEARTLEAKRAEAHTSLQKAEQARTEAQALSVKAREYETAKALASKNPRAALRALGIDPAALLDDLTNEALTGKAAEIPTDVRLQELEAQFKQQLEEAKTENERRWQAAEEDRRSQLTQAQKESEARDQQVITDYQNDLQRYASANAAKFDMLAGNPEDGAEMAWNIITAAQESGQPIPDMESALNQANLMYREEFKRVASTDAGKAMALEIAKAAGWGPAPVATVPPVVVAPKGPIATPIPARQPPNTLSSRLTATATPPPPVPGNKSDAWEDKKARAQAAYDAAFAKRRAAGMV